MSAHLGPSATAFVDGELSHERRDEVLAHLAHCADCRGEVALIRALKSALRSGPDIPGDLSTRLLNPGTVTAEVRRPVHRRSRPRLRRTVAGGAFLALGVGGALSLAGPPPAGPPVRIDPSSEQFLIEHASTTGGVPFSGPEVVTVSSTTDLR